MDLVTLDFETAYGAKLKLGFKHQTTQQYLCDPRFEIIGVATKINNAPTIWGVGRQEAHLKAIDWGNSVLIAHNALFDASILSWHYGIKPKHICDTLSMARALHGVDAGGSLKALAARYNIGVKGDEVVHAENKFLRDFTAEELERYGDYCRNDVDLTYDLYWLLKNRVNRVERALIDMTVRMHSEPQFTLDRFVLDGHLRQIQLAKEEMLYVNKVTRDDLMSNDKFAALLRRLGVEPPMKDKKPTKRTPNPTGQTYAFAKVDEGFKALLEHPNPKVQNLCAARLGHKSTLEEKRTERFINILDECEALPAPLKYYGAMTGRWAATDKINLQNLPRGSMLKKAITVAEGYCIVGADLSNIELRVGLYFAGQMEKVNLLGSGADLYKDFAASVFDVAYDEVDEYQRFIGKTCVAHGTPVLCDSGWKPIQKVTINDKLWDGEEWVCHQGLQSNGYKETLNLCGSWLTPDHLVWSGTQWLESQSVVSDSCILSQVLDTGAANLPLQATYKAPEEALLPSSSSATVDAQSTRWTNIISKISKALGAINAVLKPERQSAFGIMHRQCLTMSTGEDCLTDWPRLSADATSVPTPITRTTGDEAFTYTRFGAKTKLSFSDTCRRLLDGIGQSLTWIVSITMTVMRRAMSGLFPKQRTRETSAKSASSRRKLPVYDLLCAGPRNRFTILTDAGPLIVHNCQLSLIYGTGPGKLRGAIKTMSGKDIGEKESQRIVDLYREEYYKVVRAWAQGKVVLDFLRKHAQEKANGNGLVLEGGYGTDALSLEVYGLYGIKFPSGMFLLYPDLQEAEGSRELTYYTRKGRTRIYGAKCFQNVTQGLARCVMGEAMVRIHKRYPVALTIHDAVYCVVPEEEAEEARRFIITELRKEPAWAPGIPLDAEGGYGKNLSFKMTKL